MSSAAAQSASMLLQRAVDDVLRFPHQNAQMVLTAETLGVNLVDVLGARWTCGEPSAGGDHLYSADPRIISRYNSAGSRPLRAVISAASSAGTMPSLSVVHTVPSIRKKEAPALSS